MAAKPEGFKLQGLIRANILKLQPYRCARDDYTAGVLLDANENALGPSIAHQAVASTSRAQINGTNGHTDSQDLDENDEYAAMGLNRYPDPVQGEIKDRFAALRNFCHGRKGTFLGVGSDEIIDMLIRITCTPGAGTGDKILICPPTYGMYSVSAAVNDVDVIKCALDTKNGKFQPRLDALFEILSGEQASKIKLLFLTSPGNPTGSSIPPETIRKVLNHPTWRGLVIVDEAYIDFSQVESATSLFEEGWQNLVVMQTLSKGFGLAGIRLGVSFQDPAIAHYLACTKAPYNISTPTATLALRALSDANIASMKEKTDKLIKNRGWLLETLKRDFAQSIGPSLGTNDANFILVPVYSRSGAPSVNNKRANAIYIRMAEEKGVVVRFRGNEPGCEACLRMTIGTDEECKTLVEKLKEALDEI